MNPLPADPTVLVIGDAWLDHHTTITLDHPSGHEMQASGPTLTSPGGAANVAMNIAAMGRRVQVVGLAGDDQAGNTLAACLADADNVWPRLVNCGVSRATITVRRYVRYAATARPLLTVADHYRDNAAVHDAELMTMFTAALDAATIGAVAFVDRDYGTLPTGLIARLLPVCHARNLPTFVLSPAAKLHAYTGATVLTMSYTEAKAAAENYIHPGLASVVPQFEQAEVLAQYLAAQHRIHYVVIACDDGSVIHSLGGGCTVRVLKGYSVVDTEGVDETFLAALIVGYLTQHTVDKAVHRANIAAGVAAQRCGLVPVTRDAWEDARMQVDGALAKLMTWAEFVEFAARAKRANQRVVFLAASFDPWQPSHLATLEFAAQQGAVLMVAYNSDVSLQSNGLTPHLAEHLRGQGLASLAHVAAVTCFDAADATDLVKRVRPDVLVSTVGLQARSIPGADFVASHGGVVVFAPPPLSIDKEPTDAA